MRASGVPAKRLGAALVRLTCSTRRGAGRLSVISGGESLEGGGSPLRPGWHLVESQVVGVCEPHGPHMAHWHTTRVVSGPAGLVDGGLVDAGTVALGAAGSQLAVLGSADGAVGSVAVLHVWGTALRDQALAGLFDAGAARYRLARPPEQGGADGDSPRRRSIGRSIGRSMGGWSASRPVERRGWPERQSCSGDRAGGRPAGRAWQPTGIGPGVSQRGACPSSPQENYPADWCRLAGVCCWQADRQTGTPQKRGDISRRAFPETPSNRNSGGTPHAALIF